MALSSLLSSSKNDQLALERNRLAVLLQSLTEGVFATDEAGRIEVLNRAAERILEVSAKEAIGQPVDAVLPFYRGDAPYVLSDYSKQGKEVKRLLRTPGLSIKVGSTMRQLALSVAPVLNSSQQQAGWIVSFHDITKERELEAMKLDFVSMAAHELRTPLTALRGYLSIVTDEMGTQVDANLRKFIDRSLISANQLSALVENLLNVSRIERGALKLELMPMQIETLVEESLVSLREVAKQKDITLTFTKPKEPLPQILADQFRLGEVVANLVANGINYTKSGGWVTITTEVRDKQLAVHISDNGHGIPEASMTHLFTKFYRVQSSLAVGSKGTGLGLYISKAIIDGHHGKIWAVSEEGKGSTFSFSLPLTTATAKTTA